jgi:hypothetical protein
MLATSLEPIREGEIGGSPDAADEGPLPSPPTLAEVKGEGGEVIPPPVTGSPHTIKPRAGSPPKTAMNSELFRQVSKEDDPAIIAPPIAHRGSASKIFGGDHATPHEKGSSSNIFKNGSFGSFSSLKVKRNSTFASANRLDTTDSRSSGGLGINVDARRSMSFDRFALKKNLSASDAKNGDRTRTVIGKGLKRGSQLFMKYDELDEETHKVDDAVLENVVIVHPELAMEANAEEEGKEEDDNVCIMIGHNKGKTQGIRRSSEVFIGGDGFYPLSQIKMPRPVYFGMRFGDFEDVKHLTNGSNSVIFKGKPGKLVSHHHTGITLPKGIVLKLLDEHVEDARRAKREFDFERDILAALK